jgi:ATPase subunit of ABC transporter with duplicated ATPase domains
LFVVSVEALSDALSEWGDDEGALVVISHDKAFCEQVGFTHVLTIQEDGTLKLEQRNTNEGDWDSSKSTLQRTQQEGNNETTATATTAGADSDKGMDAMLRKQAYNAPKRIAQIESLIEKKEQKIAALDSEMLANGKDVGKLVDLTKEKEALEAEVMELMEEWGDLETLLAKVQAAGTTSK